MVRDVAKPYLTTTVGVMQHACEHDSEQFCFVSGGMHFVSGFLMIYGDGQK